MGRIGAHDCTVIQRAACWPVIATIPLTTLAYTEVGGAGIFYGPLFNWVTLYFCGPESLFSDILLLPSNCP